MYALMLALVLQVQPGEMPYTSGPLTQSQTRSIPQQTPRNQHASRVEGAAQLVQPQIKSVQRPSPPPAIRLQYPSEVTTPTLLPDSEIHAQMEKDIGGQIATVSAINKRVGELETNRGTYDRPDIDDLKNTRSHARWVLGFLSLVALCVWNSRKHIWSYIAPILKRELAPRRRSTAQSEKTV